MESYRSIARSRMANFVPERTARPIGRNRSGSLPKERLHQTHSSLKAYRAASVESILGRDPGAAELSGFVLAVLYPQSHGAPRMLVADPLAYDLERLPGGLEWTIVERPALNVISGEMIRPVREWTSQALDRNSHCIFPRGIELTPKNVPVAGGAAQPASFSFNRDRGRAGYRRSGSHRSFRDTEFCPGGNFTSTDGLADASSGSANRPFRTAGDAGAGRSEIDAAATGRKLIPADASLPESREPRARTSSSGWSFDARGL